METITKIDKVIDGIQKILTWKSWLVIPKYDIDFEFFTRQDMNILYYKLGKLNYNVDINEYGDLVISI